MNDIIYVDEDDNEIGSGSLKHALEHGIIRRVSRVILSNDSGEILLQRRGDVVAYPRLWNDSVSGHVDVGETYRGAAVREMKEEMGISGVSLDEVGKFYGGEKEGDVVRKAFNMLYAGAFNGTPTIDPHEVSAFRWVQPDVLKQWLAQKPRDFTPGSASGFQFYFKKR